MEIITGVLSLCGPRDQDPKKDPADSRSNYFLKHGTTRAGLGNGVRAGLGRLDRPVVGIVVRPHTGKRIHLFYW